MATEPIHTDAAGAPARRRPKVFVYGYVATGILAVAALLTAGFWGVQGLGAADAEALESPLILTVARELEAGPGALYGPFNGGNPWVLIHAPLYYRLAAAAAWPIHRAGASTVVAARIAGRLISVLSLLAALGAAYGLARLEGGSRLAGWWAVLLIAAAPGLDSSAVTVRPDVLGVALQTTGLFLVLSALGGGPGADRRVVGAYLAFGLAVCVKQHLIAEAVVCTALLVVDRRGSAIPGKTIARGLIAAGAVVATVFGAEWIVTGGRIWDAAVVAAGEASRVHPGGLGHAELILYGFLKRSAGFLVLLPMIGLTFVGSRFGVVRTALFLAGLGVVGVNLAYLADTLVTGRRDLEIAGFLTSLTAGPIFLLCAVAGRSTVLGNRIDGVLWVCLAAELAGVAALAYLSTGSWLNYAVEATVLLAVLTARAGGRVLEAAPTFRRAWPLGLGASAIFFASYLHIVNADYLIRLERAAVTAILDRLQMPRSAVFFSDRPGLNRLGGRVDLVYDPWLYQVFEAARLAEPRSVWLREILAQRDVRAVVGKSEESVIGGTGISLPSLGFRPDLRVGPFYVWTR